MFVVIKSRRKYVLANLSTTWQSEQRMVGIVYVFIRSFCRLQWIDASLLRLPDYANNYHYINFITFRRGTLEHSFAS